VAGFARALDCADSAFTPGRQILVDVVDSIGEAIPLDLTVARCAARVELLGWGERESLVIKSNTLMRSRSCPR